MHEAAELDPGNGVGSSLIRSLGFDYRKEVNPYYRPSRRKQDRSGFFGSDPKRMNYDPLEDVDVLSSSSKGSKMSKASQMLRKSVKKSPLEQILDIVRKQGESLHLLM